MLNNISPIVLSSPGTIAFHIGTWPIHWYGIFIASAFLFCYMLAENIAKKNGLDLDHLSSMIFFVLILGIIFARLWFVFLSWEYFKFHVDEIPKIWLGGQAIHGGIFGAIVAIYLYSKIKNVSFYNYIDVLAVITPLGQAIGRWGNFFNNEAFGKPASNLLISLNIPKEFRPEQYLSFQYFHPTFLYESILDFLIFVLLYKQYPSWKYKRGKTFWIYLLCYSIVRFFLEFLRVDSLYLFTNLASAHVVSLIIIVLSIIMIRKTAT